MNFFRGSTSSLSAASDPTGARASISLTPPPTDTSSVRSSGHRLSTATTATSVSSPALNGDTSSGTMSTASRVVSSFNPTKTYYIPTHGGVILSSSPLYIYDLTPHLKHRVPAADAYSDRKAFKRDVREVLKAWKEQEKDGKGKGADAMEMLEPAAVVKRGKKGGKVLEDVDSRGMASWSVPWALWKEIVVDVQYPDSDEWDVVVCTDSYDPRSQYFDLREARYRWKFVTPRELVLEKSPRDMGRYVVAVCYLTISSASFPTDLRAWAEGVVKRGAGTTEGTLLFDERGVNRLLVVATLLIALKRERQRWGVLGGTV